MGKTTALRSAIQHFDARVLSVYIFNRFLSVPEFFTHLVNGFRLETPRNASKPEIIEALGRVFMSRHRRGLRNVLIVDEAHGLPTEVLEEIRLLSNFETNNDKL